MISAQEKQVRSLPMDEEAFIRRTIECYFGRDAAGSPLLPLKQGMTNDSFLFTANGQKYIFRYNGQGTELLIDRENEKRVYELLCSTGITEHVVALSIDPGYMISRYYESSRVCNPRNIEEVHSCMQVLRSFHERGFAVEKSFDPFAVLEFYERLVPVKAFESPAYGDVRENVFSLRPFLTPFLTNNCTLCHIDAVSDNFLFVEGRDRPYLIDWEYAGVSDPLIDLAMFAIYANYTEEESDRLIAGYFPEGFDDTVRARVYAYMAVGGLLWSTWCSYKSALGTTFGAYAENQFRFAKDYSAKVQRLLGNRR